MSSIDPLWVLISTHQHLLALVSIIEYGAMASSVLMRNNKCPWSHGPPLMTVLELSRVLLAPWRQAHECSWLLMSTHGCSWVFMAALSFLWVQMSANWCSRMLMIVHEHSWAAMTSCKHSREWCHGARSTNEHSLVLMSTHENGVTTTHKSHGAMAPYS